MKEIQYKMFYKLSGTVWKHFFFDESNDQEAKEYAARWAERNNIERYSVVKITTEGLV